MLKKTIGLTLAVAFLSTTAPAVVQVINFDNFTGRPSTFAGGGPEFTVTSPGVGSVSGGLVLSSETFLPIEKVVGTLPNTYATGNISGADPSLSPYITISVDPTNVVNQFSFVLMNGLTTPTGYRVDAYSGANITASQYFSALAPNTPTGGYAIVSFTNPNTTQIVITPDSTTYFDYAIDTVTFGSLKPAAVPEPMSMIGLGIAAVALIRKRSR